MAQSILSAAILLALGLLTLALLLTVMRVVRGPTIADRVVALDMLVAVAIGLIAVIAVKTGFFLYIDIAIALGLVGFLATVAFARFILSHRHRAADEGAGKPAADTVRRSNARRNRRPGRARR
ncbi:cation:proton antiporter [Rhizobium sp. LjRoot30]|uniref:cation:proton antiporter n=1 Tax=Rhizobium sp. LjRoot30 TaxID=3342320 RepID=UPI003F4F6657